ncbi:MAG TPA: ABC transporter permease subunit [Pseudonocardiaceae bacterium]|nr:ABC transporter permease subunit [Pseudonocardiaceae bacterium]
MNGRLLRGVAGLVGVFLVWEIVSRTGLVDAFLLPPPTGVVARVFSLLGEADFQVALIATLLTWLLSLGITIAIAVPLGIVLGSVPGVRTATSAVIEFVRPIPAVSLIPVALVLLGGGPATNITLAAFAGTWPLLFNVMGAVRETDPMLLDTAKSFGLGTVATAVRVRLPAVARAAVTGLRVTAGLELIVIVSVGLLTIIDGGVGGYLWTAGESLGDTITVLAGTVIIGVLGYAVNQGLLALLHIKWLHPTASGAPERGQRGSSRWWVRFLQRWGTFVVAIGLWQLVAVRADDPNVPPPVTIAQTIWHNASLVVNSTPLSLARLGTGWIIAAVVGVGMGLLFGQLPRAADVVEPVGAFLRAIPPVLLMPILVIWFQLGDTLEIVTIALGCGWPIFVQTIEGVRSIEPVLLDTSHSYGTGRLRHMFGVVAPAAAPKIVTGLRVSLSLALILMVITELLGQSSGLGYELDQAGSTFDYPTMWACIVLLGVLGYLLNTILLAADRRLVSWRHEGATEE